jgi:hypothetical protein
MNPGAAGLYIGAGAESAAAAQRAAEVRRRLANGARQMRAEPDGDEELLIGRWMDAAHSQVPGDDEYRPGAGQNDEEIG